MISLSTPQPHTLCARKGERSLSDRISNSRVIVCTFTCVEAALCSRISFRSTGDKWSYCTRNYQLKFFCVYTGLGISYNTSTLLIQTKQTILNVTKHRNDVTIYLFSLKQKQRQKKKIKLFIIDCMVQDEKSLINDQQQYVTQMTFRNTCSLYRPISQPHTINYRDSSVIVFTKQRAVSA